MIRLVAEREIRTRLRARSFRIALLISVGAVVVGIVAPHELASKPGPYRVELVGRSNDATRRAITSAGEAVGRGIRIVDDDADLSAARDDLRTKDADLVVVDGERLVVRQVPARTDSGTFNRFLETVNGSLRLYAGLFASGLTPDEATAALSHPPLPVEGVLTPKPDRTSQKTITSVGIILIFVAIQQYGAWVLNGIVEEKASRVVEVLLSVVRPRELLVGKTLGIGLVALAQGVLVATAALVTSAAIGASLLEGGGGAIIVSLVGWFVLAYALYGLLMAMAGSLVARQEEAQNAAFPFTVPLLIAYVTSISTVFGDTVPPIVKVMSFIPLTAPISMPARLAAGNVPAAQVVLSVAIMLVSIAVVARVAAAVYARGVLQTSRLRWRDVFGNQRR